MLAEWISAQVVRRLIKVLKYSESMGAIREFGNVFMSSFWAVLGGTIFFVLGTLAAGWGLSVFFGIDPLYTITLIAVVILSILIGLVIGFFMGKLIFRFRRKRTRPYPSSPEFGYATIKISEQERYR